MQFTLGGAQNTKIQKMKAFSVNGTNLFDYMGHTYVHSWDVLGFTTTKDRIDVRNKITSLGIDIKIIPELGKWIADQNYLHPDINNVARARFYDLQELTTVSLKDIVDFNARAISLNLSRGDPIQYHDNIDASDEPEVLPVRENISLGPLVAEMQECLMIEMQRMHKETQTNIVAATNSMLTKKFMDEEINRPTVRAIIEQKIRSEIRESVMSETKATAARQAELMLEKYRTERQRVIDEEMKAYESRVRDQINAKRQSAFTEIEAERAAQKKRLADELSPEDIAVIKRIHAAIQ